MWRALEGKGDTITSGPATWTPPLDPDVFWVQMVSLGVVVTTTLQLGLHNGDMAWGAFLDPGPPSEPTLGWMRSGERALRSKGDPGSADLGRPETQNFLPAALPALK